MKQAKTEGRTIPVVSNFQRMARRPGGMAKERVIHQADKDMEEIRPAMVEWLQNQVADLDAAVASIIANEANADTIAQARVISDQVRDLGATLGFPLLTFVAGHLGEIFEALTAGANNLSEIITCHHAVLKLSMMEDYRLMSSEDLPELRDGLSKVLHIARNRAPVALAG